MCIHASYEISRKLDNFIILRNELKNKKKSSFYINRCVDKNKLIDKIENKIDG
jgi:hypothetical protein